MKAKEWKTKALTLERDLKRPPKIFLVKEMTAEERTPSNYANIIINYVNTKAEMPTPVTITLPKKTTLTSFASF